MPQALFSSRWLNVNLADIHNPRVPRLYRNEVTLRDVDQVAQHPSRSCHTWGRKNGLLIALASFLVGPVLELGLSSSHGKSSANNLICPHSSSLFVFASPSIIIPPQSPGFLSDSGLFDVKIKFNLDENEIEIDNKLL